MPIAAFLSILLVASRGSTQDPIPSHLKREHLDKRLDDLPQSYKDSKAGKMMIEKWKDTYDHYARLSPPQRDDVLRKILDDVNEFVFDEQVRKCNENLMRTGGSPSTSAADAYKGYLECSRAAVKDRALFRAREFIAMGAKMVGDPTADYNCDGMVLGELLGDEWSTYGGEGVETPLVYPMTATLLRKMGFEKSKKPCPCGVVIYRNSKGVQLHMGVVADTKKGLILSKWGQGRTGVWLHPLAACPYESDNVEYWCPPDGSAEWCHKLLKRFGV